MKWSIAFALICCLGASACDDGVASASASCVAYCKKLEVCDDATDQSGCEARCDEQRVRSASYLGARSECVDKLSCNLWQGEVGLMGEDICASDDRCQLNKCVTDTLYKKDLTPEQKAYCSNTNTKINACDRTLDVTTLDMHCTDLVGTLSPEYLNEMQGCINSECALLVSCLKRAAARFDTDLTIYPGSLAAAP